MTRNRILCSLPQTKTSPEGLLLFFWWAIQEFTFAKAKVIRGASPQSISNEFEMLIVYQNPQLGWGFF
jgi:hypothetical protein